MNAFIKEIDLYHKLEPICGMLIANPVPKVPLNSNQPATV